jgi:ubiquitin carboxyl-terminal hydrolase 5/13
MQGNCHHQPFHCTDTNDTRHYVAFVRKTIHGEDKPTWVLFNDEKVAKAGDIDEMKKFAYVYFFRRT